MAPWSIGLFDSNTPVSGRVKLSLGTMASVNWLMDTYTIMRFWLDMQTSVFTGKSAIRERHSPLLPLVLLPGRGPRVWYCAWGASSLVRTTGLLGTSFSPEPLTDVLNSCLPLLPASFKISVTTSRVPWLANCPSAVTHLSWATLTLFVSESRHSDQRSPSSRLPGAGLWGAGSSLVSHSTKEVIFSQQPHSSMGWGPSCLFLCFQE